MNDALQAQLAAAELEPAVRFLVVSARGGAACAQVIQQRGLFPAAGDARPLIAAH